ncbi:MAG: SDR family oxidoreductase [Acidimicrobiia bacterium]
MRTHPAFLTGATGFLGSNLALELLESRRDRIYCLVRPNGDVTDRLHRAVLDAARAAGRLEHVEGRLDQLVPIPGDVAVPGLGLAAEHREMLGDERPVECWHAAASLRYEDRHRDEIVRTNVDGTRHVIDTVTDLGIAELNHISTAYVAGVRTGEVLEEPYDPRFEPNNWYEASKRRGEDMVVEHAGAFEAVRIMRPSIVVGNVSTFGSTSTSGYYGFLRGLARFCRVVERSEPGYLDHNTVRLFLEPHSSLDLVPIDLLCAEAVAIADGTAAGGHDHRYSHLTNPFPITLARARVGPERSIERLRLELVEDRGLLGPLDALLDDALDFYRPYLRNDKRFVRRRDGGTPPAAMHISDDALVAFSITHLDEMKRSKATVGSTVGTTS